MHACVGEGYGNPLQCSCLENPRDRGAWWAAIYGVAQSRTRLTRLSSSSSSSLLLSLTLCKMGTMVKIAPTSRSSHRAVDPLGWTDAHSPVTGQGWEGRTSESGGAYNLITLPAEAPTLCLHASRNRKLTTQVQPCPSWRLAVALWGVLPSLDLTGPGGHRPSSAAG